MDKGRILVAGGTGFIGRVLAADLAASGHEVIDADACPGEEDPLRRISHGRGFSDLVREDGVDPGSLLLKEGGDSRMGIGLQGIADPGFARRPPGEFLRQEGEPGADRLAPVDVDGRSEPSGQILGFPAGQIELVPPDEREIILPPSHDRPPPPPESGSRPFPKRSIWPLRILRTISRRTGYFSSRSSGTSTFWPVIMFRIWRALAMAWPR